VSATVFYVKRDQLLETSNTNPDDDEDIMKMDIEEDNGARSLKKKKKSTRGDEKKIYINFHQRGSCSFTIHTFSIHCKFCD